MRKLLVTGGTVFVSRICRGVLCEERRRSLRFKPESPHVAGRTAELFQLL